MKFDSFTAAFGDLPIIETAVFRAFWPSLKAASVDVDRWVKAGRLVRLRRGKYVVPERYRRTPLGLARVANLLVAPSYLGPYWALSYHGLIPEAVFGYDSITTERPVEVRSSLGTFRYRHVSARLFWGFEEERAPEGERFLVARPAKALLDLFHLTPGPFPAERLEAFRFQNTHLVSRRELRAMAARTGKPKLVSLAQRLAALFDQLEEAR